MISSVWHWLKGRCRRISRPRRKIHKPTIPLYYPCISLDPPITCTTRHVTHRLSDLGLRPSSAPFVRRSLSFSFAAISDPFLFRHDRILCASFGFAITKADIFPTVAARGAGQIIIVCIQSSPLRPSLTSHRTFLRHVLCSPKLYLHSQ